MFKPLEAEIHFCPRKALFIRFSAVLALVMFFAGAYQCKTSFLIKFVKRSELNPF